MTNQDLTLIGILVDKSGSISACLSDMQGGLDNFLKDQAAQPGECEVALSHFDDTYEEVWKPTAIAAIPPYRIVPGGMTALLDAIGRFITDVGKDLAARPENERPGKVIMTIVTDGYENASREWKDASKVRELVKHQKDVYQWEFVFLGADIDAVGVAASVGISQDSALTFTSDNAGVAYAAASSYVSNSRSGLDTSFTDSQRRQSVQK